MKNMTDNTMYTLQELHIFSKSFHLNVISSHQYFHCILQLAYQLVFFYTYNLRSLNVLQHRMLYHIHSHNGLDSKYIFYHIFLCQSILCIHIYIYHYSNVVYYYKHLHIVYIYIYKFHGVLCVLFN